MRRAMNLQNKHKTEQEEKYNVSSKNRLLTIGKKKMSTTMIGAISSFEKFFGFLWGHDAPLLDWQRSFLQKLEKAGVSKEVLKEVWTEARNEVLTKGNNQIRAFEQELDQYDVKWNKHNLPLKFKD